MRQGKSGVEKSRTRLEELMAMNAYKQEIQDVTDRMNIFLYREDIMWLQIYGFAY
jgi:hypothetical protein